MISHPSLLLPAFFFFFEFVQTHECICNCSGIEVTFDVIDCHEYCVPMSCWNVTLECQVDLSKIQATCFHIHPPKSLILPLSLVGLVCVLILGLGLLKKKGLICEGNGEEEDDDYGDGTNETLALVGTQNHPDLRGDAFSPGIVDDEEDDDVWPDVVVGNEVYREFR